MRGACFASKGVPRLDSKVSRRKVMLTLNNEQPSPSLETSSSVQLEDSDGNKPSECSGENWR